MDQAIPDLLSEISHRFRRQLARAEVLTELALSMSQAGTLAFIARSDAPTQQELVSSSGKDKGQVARALKHLEASALITRAPDPEDRRVLRLRLTPAGKRVWARLRRQRRAVGSAMLAELTEAERDELARLLEKLREGLERAAGEG